MGESANWDDEDFYEAQVSSILHPNLSAHLTNIKNLLSNMSLFYNALLEDKRLLISILEEQIVSRSIQ
jgi:hypothetical protein